MIRVNRKIQFSFNFIRMFSGPYRKEYKRCYEILEIPEGSNQEQIRTAYLLLVKRYHPDCGSENANVNKFHEIDEAFRTLCNKISSERWAKDEEEVEKHDIKHTAPQHRQYLSYDGHGIGSPFQREKQYTKQRAIRASHNVFKHRVEKASADEHALMEKKSLRHDIKTKYGLERLVEDLILEAMMKGEFSKLSGLGKPLKEKYNRNPHVDFITHKLNEILIDNGFTPEWITLNKQIRKELTTLRNKLTEERKYFKKCPLDEEEVLRWRECVSKYKSHVMSLNTKIDKFNLVVPILSKQCFHIDLDQEAKKILKNGSYCTADNFRKPQEKMETIGLVTDSSDRGTLFGFLEKLFK